MNSGKMIRFSLGVLIGLLMLNGPAEAQEIALIAHKNVTATLTQDEVQQIFLGQKTRWKDGATITFAIFAEENTFTTFLKDYIKKTAFQYNNYWKKQVFTGQGRMPKTFPDGQALIDFVAETEGAISFARLQDVDPKRVNVLKVVD
jgi:ABC-type phosphate transport system substrate-binding protein